MKKIKNFLIDRYHLLFKGAAENHLRIQNALKNPDGTYQLTLKFDSYTDLKKYQKKLRKITVSLSSAVAMVIVAFIVAPYVMNPSRSSASNFQWLSNNWSSATANTAATIDHSNQGTATSYYFKDPSIVAANGAVSLKLPDPAMIGNGGTLPAYGAVTPDSTNVYLAAGAITLKKPDTADCTSATQCKSGFCNSQLSCGTLAIGSTCANNADCSNNFCAGTPAKCLGPCVGIETAGMFCTFGGIAYGIVTGADGKLWLDRNLGAKEVATTSTGYPNGYDDIAAYGWLFQWGRGADGHQYTAWGGQASPALSATTYIPSSNITPTHGNFIGRCFSGYDGSTCNDWYTSEGTFNRWQAPAYLNNPCPPGFRVPTSTEFSAAIGHTFAAGAYSTALKLTTAGGRIANSASGTGTVGAYWTSDSLSYSGYPNFIYYGNACIFATNSYFTCQIMGVPTGNSVRCIKK